MSQSGTFNNGLFPPGTIVQTITGNAGGAVGPDGAQNINLVGSGDITVTGNPGTNTLTISVSGSVSDTYQTDAGNAVPALGIIKIVGDRDINTTGAGNTVTIKLDNAIKLGDLAPIPGLPAITLTTGDLTITAGDINLPATTSSAVGVVKLNASPFIHAYGATNTFVGSNAGNFTLTSFSTTGIGAQTLQSLTNGAFNTAGGFLSQNKVSSGSNNASFGAGSLNNLTTSSSNSAFGNGTLNALVTGTNNIALGLNAGSAYTTNESNNIIIGSVGVIADSATTRIGTNGTQTAVFVAGIDGVDVGNTAKVVTSGTGATQDKLGTATITAGTNINVTPTANTITINATGAASFQWVEINADQSALVNKGYICNKASLLTLTLPASAAQGDMIRVTGMNAGNGWKIAQNANQTIFFGNSAGTTTGVLGSLASTATRDSVEIVCIVAGASTVWNVISSVGNITVT